MKRFTVGSYFSGGGIGLATIKNRVDIAFGVEYSPEIAEVYKANIGDRIIVSRVQDVDVKKLERVDLFQVSPVCVEFSVAKTGGKESAEELSQATAICAYLDYHKPPFFVLENVRGYIKSKSFSMIVVKLSRLGYQMRYSVENSANFGVPQTRERLILRAALNGPVPTLGGYVSKWVGWYEAIEDLIPELPDAIFGDWQLARLPENFNSIALLIGNDSNRETETPQVITRTENQPAMTIKANSRSHVKGFIVDGKNASQEWGKLYRATSEPTVTITSDSRMKAFVVDGKPADNGRLLTVPNSQEPIYTLTASSDRQPSRAWLSQGRVVKMTPRALARFMSVPDGYNLTGKNSLDCRVLGNGIPSKMGEAIIGSTLGLNNDKELVA